MANSLRYTPARIEQALSTIRNRIAEINGDSRARYKVVQAVAFGDFLSDGTRVQAAEVGVWLAPRGPVEDSANERKVQRDIPQAATERTFSSSRQAVRSMDERPEPTERYYSLILCEPPARRSILLVRNSGIRSEGSDL